ncbi:unnamed protein product [Rotaria sordida]|uniref:Uncharacterized protein n=1 Tax=Rotaria sordida TaxID=392033 RepID=A0A814NJ89_9BILA|nr:unnamed protein product [Rotaria sordida]CAF3919957.1 unnamed protein product [Rotaria sordida]
MADVNISQNKENFVLIWLDRALDTKYNDLRNLAKIRDVAYSLRTYTDPTVCLEYIKESSNEKIFLIVSGTIGKEFVPLIHHLPQVQSIYVLCLHKRQQIEWTSAFSKIRQEDIFNHVSPLIDRLKIDLFKCEYVSDISFKLERSIFDIHQKMTDFKWSRLLSHTLTKLIPDRKAQQEMIDYLRDYYKDNQASLEFLDDFSKNYKNEQAIRWYTRPGCLFRSLNRSFREENIEEIYRFRSFIRDLSEQIDLLYIEQKETIGCDSYTVYRGTCLPYDDIAILKSNQGKLISFNGFLSTSFDHNAALVFIEPSSKEEQKEAVLFQFFVNTDLDTTSYAYIGLESDISDELELLFNINTIFRINKVEYDESAKQWFVRCELCLKNDVEPLYLENNDDINENHSNLYQFGILLMQAGQISQAEKFYYKLLEESSGNFRAEFNCYTGLGAVFFHLENYTHALEMYSKALDLNIQPEVIYNDMANIHVKLNEYQIAIEFYARSLSLIDDENDIHLLATTLANIANVYHLQGAYKQALEMYEKASELYVDAYGGMYQHPKQAGLYDMMAMAYRQYGMFDKAMEYYQDSLTILKKTLPTEHPSLAQCYNNIGLLFYDRDDPDSAFEYFQMALAIDEPLGHRHLRLATIYGNLAVIYSIRNQYDLAIQYHERAINICREVLSEHHPDLAIRYVDLGVTLIKQRKFDEALYVLHKARAIYENQDINTFPLDHPNYAKFYSTMADLYSEKSDFNQAFEFYTKALHIRQVYYYPDHPLIAANLHNLGVIRHRQGQYYRALGFYQRAKDLFEQVMPQNQKAITSLYDNLASLYFDKAEYELALEYYAKSLNIRRQIFDAKHPSIARSEMHLGKIHAHLRNYKDAFDYYNRALQNSDNLGEVYINLGDLHSFQNQHTNAMDFYEKALTYYKETYGDNHSYTATTYSKIGNAFYLLDNYDKAINNYMIALQIFQQIYPEDHKDIASILNNVANILSDVGQLDVAVNLYIRALEIYRKHFTASHPEVLTSQTNIAHCCRVLARQCVEQRQWQEALDFCQEALEIYEKVLPVGSTERESTLTSVKNDMDQLRDLITSSVEDTATSMQDKISE